MATVTKPVALDETLQATNSALVTQSTKLNDIIAKLQLIATALGNPELIGDTDISEIADGTITGAIAEIDGDVTDLQEDMLTVQGDIDNIEDALSDDVVTATGNPISITTLSAQYAQSTKINIEPIQDGSGDPSPSNIRPIVGRSYASFNVHGKNELEINITAREFQGITFTPDGNGGIILNGTASDTVIIGNLATGYYGTGTGQNDGKKHIANGAYRRNSFPANSGISLQIVATNNPSGTSEIAFLEPIDGVTTVDDTYRYNYCRLFISSGKRFDNLRIQPMIYRSNLDDTFEPYKSPTNLTYNFGQAVFGGNLDVNSGKLTVTMENIPSYAGETLPGAWISDRDVYVVGTTPTTGAQVVYDIASPYIIQLSGAEVELLKGLNNVITDANNITLTYRGGEVATLADVVELDKKIDASGAAGHVYSQNEHIIGTWDDGKTLYEKNYTYDISTTITAGDTLLYFEPDMLPKRITGFFRHKTQDRVYPIPYVNGTSTASFFYNENGYICLRISNDSWGNSYEVSITVNYTKVTD